MVLEQLSTAGLFGLFGLVVLLVGTWVVLWRINPTYGLLPLSVLLNRIIQGQLDLFWIAVQTSLPFLVIGITLGALAREERASPSRPHEPALVEATP
jgi:hypothetical protein